MEPKKNLKGRMNQSITLKAVIVGVLALLLLIPGSMIQRMITERQQRSYTAISEINSRWSKSQTLAGPVIVVPYTESKMVDGKLKTIDHELKIAPTTLNVKVNLSPEVKHFSIYKTILYKSVIDIDGTFPNMKSFAVVNAEMHWWQAYLQFGLSDLKGISKDIVINLNGKELTAEADGNSKGDLSGLVFYLKGMLADNKDSALHFSSRLDLKGSESMSFIPIARTTNVNITGAWSNPGFIGSFSPDSKISNKNFSAKWNILHFNRNIPDSWNDSDNESNFSDASFGVNLVSTVDQYQQNMRSAKYAIMFIALTFLVFFFVEILTKKRIHPLQYLLVGFALLIFYTLLLSISEQIGFGWAYLVASVATVGLITAYAGNIFKNIKHTGILCAMLTLLYVFLYVVLQLEDVAFLVGSIGLFIILGVVMYVSRNIKWYQDNGEE